MILSFDAIKRTLKLKGYDEGLDFLSIDREGFMALINAILEFAPFDETEYLSLHPDVKQAVEKGDFESGKQHYCLCGFYENRFPGYGDFDPLKYARAHPDLHPLINEQNWAELLRNHFRDAGYREGRKTGSKST